MRYSVMIPVVVLFVHELGDQVVAVVQRKQAAVE